MITIFLAITAVTIAPPPCDPASQIQALVPAGSSWAWSPPDGNSVHFVDGNPAIPPTAAQINAQIALCQTTHTTNQTNFQADLFTINSSTPTTLEAAIIDVLRLKGVLVPL